MLLPQMQVIKAPQLLHFLRVDVMVGLHGSLALVKERHKLTLVADA